MRSTFMIVLALWAELAAGQVPIACTVRRLPITVINREGHPVTGLSAANFRAEVRGRPVVLDSVTARSDPAILMFLDASGSMTPSIYRPNWKWSSALKAAKAVVLTAPPDRPLILGVFARRVLQVEQGRSAVLKALSVLESHPPTLEQERDRRTAIFDSVLEIVSDMKAGASIQAAYLFSDGGENTDPDSFDRLRDSLLASNIRFFAFLVTEEPQKIELKEELFGPEMMKRLSHETGGTSVTFAPMPWDVPDSEASLARFQYTHLAHWYEVDLPLPAASHQREKWKLEVLDPAGKRKRDVRIFYPQHLLPCRGSN